MSVRQVHSNPSALSVVEASRFSEVHQRYHARLLCAMLGFVHNPEAAKDITAAAFAKAFERLDQFRGESCLYTWLYAIAANEARKWLRAGRTVSLDALQGPEPEGCTFSDATFDVLEQSDDSRRLQAALHQVPQRYRRPLVKHFMGGQSIKAIARAERIPFGTVLSRIFTGKRLLRQAWEAG